MNRENVRYSFAGIEVDEGDLIRVSLACFGLAILRKAGRVSSFASIADFRCGGGLARRPFTTPDGAPDMGALDEFQASLMCDLMKHLRDTGAVVPDASMMAFTWHFEVANGRFVFELTPDDPACDVPGWDGEPIVRELRVEGEEGQS